MVWQRNFHLRNVVVEKFHYNEQNLEIAQWMPQGHIAVSYSKAKIRYHDIVNYQGNYYNRVKVEHSHPIEIINTQGRTIKTFTQPSAINILSPGCTDFLAGCFGSGVAGYETFLQAGVCYRWNIESLSNGDLMINSQLCSINNEQGLTLPQNIARMNL